MKKEIQYPAEITFKSVFTHSPDLHESIQAILIEYGVDGQISHKPSKNSRFISFTITAQFESESHLNEVCTRLTTIAGFIMMI